MSTYRFCFILYALKKFHLYEFMLCHNSNSLIPMDDDLEHKNYRLITLRIPMDNDLEHQNYRLVTLRIKYSCECFYFLIHKKGNSFLPLFLHH
jgi:hypothetical protein